MNSIFAVRYTTAILHVQSYYELLASPRVTLVFLIGVLGALAKFINEFNLCGALYYYHTTFSKLL